MQVRSKTTKGGHSNQCTYGEDGRLMKKIPAAGSADYKACTNIATCWWKDGEPHYDHDVATFKLAQTVGRVKDY